MLLCRERWMCTLRMGASDEVDGCAEGKGEGSGEKKESFFYVKLMLFLKVSVCLGFVWVLVVVGFWGSGVCDMSVISIVSG